MFLAIATASSIGTKSSSFFSSLTPSDWIQIIGITVSSGISLMTLFLSFSTLLQNNKMLKESSRPYIFIYLDAITLCEQRSYFVLKNFGRSPATITQFEYDPVLKGTPQEAAILQEQFDFIEGITLAPGQSKLLQYDVAKLSKDSLSFYFSYTTGKDEYHESISMNAKNYIHLPVLRPKSHVAEEDERLVHTLREILERRM